MGKQRHPLHENPRLWLLIGLLSGLSAVAGAVMAAEDDLRADSLCIDPDGDNCATPFNDAEIRLEADTVRMRFLDSTAGTTEDGLGNSWSLLANDYSAATNPQNYFSFRLRKVPDPEGGSSIAGKHLLRLGPSSSTNGSAGAVAIGLDSEFLEDTVSLGTAHVKRRLMHVAEGLQDTNDALIKRQLDEGLLGSVGDIADRLDELEGEVAALERRVAGNDGSSGSGGGSSGGGGGLMGMPTLVFLAALLGITWRRRTVAV